MEDLDTSIRGLLRVIAQVQNRSLDGVDFMKSSKPYWHICVEKFHAAYIKAKNPDGFRDMFAAFFEKHSDKFTEDVIDEDGDINDTWLKNKEVLTKSSKKKKAIDEGAFSLRNINCRGEVIYFDESNEKIRNVSIPISEAYLGACKIYADGAKRGEYSPLPAQLLNALFNVMSFVCGAEDMTAVNKNIKSLKEIIEQLTNGEESNSSVGDTLNPLGNIVKTFTKKFGIDSGNLDMSNIEKTVGNIFNEDVMNKAKGMWNEFNTKVGVTENADLGTIITNVSNAMKDEELQAKLKDGIAEIASKVGLPGISLSKEDEAKISPDGAVADEQE